MNEKNSNMNFEDEGECLSSPCGVGGKCTDEVHSYEFTCHPGYSGNLREKGESQHYQPIGKVKTTKAAQSHLRKGLRNPLRCRVV